MVLCNIYFKDEETLWIDFNSWEKGMRKSSRRLAAKKWLFIKFFHCVRLNLPHSLNFLSNILRLLLFNIYFMKAKAVLTSQKISELEPGNKW